MASVELKGVCKSFDGVPVVQDLSLSIQDGEFLVLVGPSGCGKSTTLRMIAGLESADHGELLMGEQPMNNVLPKDRDIGMVFQSYALYPHMTVFDNMAFGLKMRRLPKLDIRARVEDVAESLGLSEYLGRRPAQLSGGQRQRVAMGRAIAREPKVFLFDEPLSNLDAALRVDMRAELSALHRRLKTTMVYVTHDQTEAMTLGTRIAVLHQGRLQQIDTPVALFDEPVNQFVAGFMGSPKMNFIPAKLVTGGSHFDTPLGNCLNPWAELANDISGEITLGIRPAHLCLVEDALSNAVVTMVEPMGWETRIHLESGGVKTMVQQMGGSSRMFEPGESVCVQMNSSELYAFDANGQTQGMPARLLKPAN